MYFKGSTVNSQTRFGNLDETPGLTVEPDSGGTYLIRSGGTTSTNITGYADQSAAIAGLSSLITAIAQNDRDNVERWYLAPSGVIAVNLRVMTSLYVKPNISNLWDIFADGYGGPQNTLGTYNSEAEAFAGLATLLGDIVIL